MAEQQTMLAVKFEVYGKVQGVFFRKNTEAKAQELHLRGHVMNTARGTVKGEMEGPVAQVDTMCAGLVLDRCIVQETLLPEPARQLPGKYWLEHTGSPNSKIEKAVFSEEREIDSYSYEGFGIKR